MAEFERGPLFIHLFEEWSQFFERCNWYTFRFVLLEFENDETLGGVEITLAIFGLGVRVRWNHTETETIREIKEQVAEIQKGQRHDG